MNPTPAAATIGNASSPFGPGCPEAMPSTVDDLHAWEPAAVHAFLRLSGDVAAWASARSMPIFMSITEGLNHRRREVERYDTDRAFAPMPNLGAGLAANILLLRGVEDLWELWNLGQVIVTMWTQSHDDAVTTLRCHRAGYTRALVAALAEREMAWHYPETWMRVFALSDLTLLLDAGYSREEIEATVESGVFPDRSMLTMMRGLLLDPTG